MTFNSSDRSWEVIVITKLEKGSFYFVFEMLYDGFGVCWLYRGMPFGIECVRAQFLRLWNWSAPEVSKK